MYNWERRDKQRTKGKAFKFKKNADANKNNKARHRFRDEVIDVIDEQDEYDELLEVD